MLSSQGGEGPSFWSVQCRSMPGGDVPASIKGAGILYKPGVQLSKDEKWPVQNPLRQARQGPTRRDFGSFQLWVREGELCQEQNNTLSAYFWRQILRNLGFSISEDH